MIVSIFLIGAAVNEKVYGEGTSATIVGGITASSGSFLLVVSILGLIAAVKPNQACLFAYMIILFQLFMIQFPISCAVLCVNRDTERLVIAINCWTSALKYDNYTIKLAEETFNCCGLLDNSTGFECHTLDCWPYCLPCFDAIVDLVDYVLHHGGRLGLLFALTELIGGIVACRYRNLLVPINSGVSKSDCF